MIQKLKRLLPRIEISRTAPAVETVDEILSSMNKQMRKLKQAGEASVSARNALRAQAESLHGKAVVADMQADRCFRAASKLAEIVG